MPIPPRARARAPPEASGRGAGEGVAGVAPPGAGARCTAGEGPDGVDELDGRAGWDGRMGGWDAGGGWMGRDG
ncbi:hypothetical protein [Streptomyces sp. NPDC048142]|uniref:hypothetical protein n=1 Tax=Streptomyces sp. NPDC048142 TaxID=3365501 RepID=UPI0037114B9E